MTHDTSQEIIWKGNWREATPEEQIATLKAKIAELEKENHDANEDIIRLMNERNAAEERGAESMAAIFFGQFGYRKQSTNDVETAMRMWRERRAGR